MITISPLFTREEFLQSLDAKLEENKRLYGKTEADWLKEQCPDWQTMKPWFPADERIGELTG